MKSLSYTGKDLSGLVPGANVAHEAFRRLTGGVYQLVQGLSASAFRSAAGVFASIATSGYETAKSMESSAIAFETLLKSEEEAAKLANQIRKDAMVTPFDVTGLAEATQKLIMVSKNGITAEKTLLNLGKAVTAAGGGDLQLKNLSTYLQQIGINAKVTQRQLNAFGTAGVNIIQMVYDRFHEANGKSLADTKDWLQSISNPYEVLAEAINAAGEEGGQFADVYKNMTGTIEQLTANMYDAVGTFGEQVGKTSGLTKQLKDAIAAIATEFNAFDTIGDGARNMATVAEALKRYSAASVLLTLSRELLME